MSNTPSQIQVYFPHGSGINNNISVCLTDASGAWQDPAMTYKYTVRITAFCRDAHSSVSLINNHPGRPIPRPLTSGAWQDDILSP